MRNDIKRGSDLMSEVVLSIILPVYNCEKYFEQCMESLIKQDLESYEIIIIDDGSTDNTPNICDNYKKQYEFIKVIHKCNEGQGIARNVGIEAAKGKYVAFVDSDDYSSENTYGKAVSVLESNNAQLCVCNWTLTNKNIKSHSFSEVENVTIVEKKNALIELSTPSDFFSSAVWNKIYIKNVIIENNIRFKSEREYISEDYLFNFEYIRAVDKIVVSDIILYHYRVSEASFCHRYQNNYFDRLVKMKEYLDDQIEKEDETIKIKSAAYKKMFSFIKTCIIQEVSFKEYNSAKNQIKAICKSPHTQNMLKNVDRQNLDRANKILFILIKFKLSRFIYLLYKLKK